MSQREGKEKLTVHLTKGFQRSSIVPGKVSDDNLKSNQICAYVGQPKKFSVDTNFGDFIVHCSIAALKFCKENLSTNFGLFAVFVKVAFEITKKTQHCVLPGFTCFQVFRNRASLLGFSRL